MRHRDTTKSLGRKKNQREALFRGMADSLILKEKIKTTLVKAKTLRMYIEPLITKAKKVTLADRRTLIKSLYQSQAVNKMMNEIGPRYKERAGGYTRITKLGVRKNDAAEMALIEFV
jgi:large subunit ribosomal protein L17